jgi:O-antigen/teichoic acid export membrane protein
LTGFLVWDALRRHRDARPDGDSVAVPPALPRDRWRLFLFALCSQMSVYSDTIVVSLILGVDSVVPFTLTQRLLLLVDGQILAIGAVTWAALAELHHRGEADRMNRRLVTLTRATAVLGFGILLPVAAATRAFVHLWVGPVGYGGLGLTLATLGWTCQHGLIALWAWPLMATGHVRRVLPVMILGAVVSVTVSILVTKGFGVIGPAIGSLANYTLVAVWWLPLLLRRTFGTSVRALAAAVARPAALAVPYAAGLFLLSDAFPVDEFAIPLWSRWFILAAAMTVAAVAYCVLAWFLVLPREDRHELRARFFHR